MIYLRYDAALRAMMAEDELKKDRVRCFHRLRSGEAFIDANGLIWYKMETALTEKGYRIAG